MIRSLHPPTAAKPSNRVNGPIIRPVPAAVERPFWSVMIPTYNPNINYLEEGLNSVLEQAPGPQEMQIELIDDGSADFDPQGFLHKVAGSRVSFYRQPQHVGIGGNWNTCIERARGHWVHLLHQDDLVSSGFYCRLRRGIECEPKIGAALCHQFMIDNEGHRKYSPPRIKGNTAGILTDWLEYVFVGLSFSTPTIVVKRSVYEQLGGFDSSFNYALDWDMWKRIASQYPLWWEPEPLAGNRRHEQTTTRKLMRSGTNIAEIRRSIETAKSYLPAEMAENVAHRARDFYTIHALRTAANLLFKRDAVAALAQLREARKIQSSMAAVAAISKVSVATIMKLSLKTLGARRWL